MERPPPRSTLFPNATLSRSVLGSADTEQGRVWASTQLGELTVAPPLVAMSVDLTRVEQGKSAPLVVKVENKSPFEGKANVDRKSTRLNSSHANISYAVFCLK